MLSVHAGPPPAPRRQLFVGTAVVGAAIVTLVGGMLATWMRLRTSTLHSGALWVPKKILIPEVPTNVMLVAFIPLCLFCQWAVYAAKRDDRSHAGLALGLAGLMGLAVINAMVYSFTQIKLPVRGGAYNSMYYAITISLTTLFIVGVVFTVTCLFRYLGGRSSDREIVAAHALFWYVLAGCYAAVWLAVFVTK
jgi:heme/copper-type cytochrome/quinol oxidase subunit 3